VLCWILPSSFLLVMPSQHLKTSTELETLCHIHFVADFKMILFVAQKANVIHFICSISNKISECVNIVETSLSGKIDFFQKFLLSITSHFTICTPLLLILITSKILRDQDSVLLNYVHRTRTKEPCGDFSSLDTQLRHSSLDSL
jgi:hypothetical protein